MVLSARFVKQPKLDRSIKCDHCIRPITAALIRLYGMAHEGEKPYTLRFHVECVAQIGDISQEPKIAAALKKANGPQSILIP
jgi:hypothetical protein